MSDFKIVSGGKTFPCHKLVLAARSSVLMTMLENDMMEVENDTMEAREEVLTLNHIEPDIVKSLIKFIYTGKVDDLETKATSLLGIADCYKLPGLTKLCEGQLISAITI